MPKSFKLQFTIKIQFGQSNIYVFDNQYSTRDLVYAQIIIQGGVILPNYLFKI